MDVTRSNFNKVLEDIENVIEDSTFIAIDGEFTGLTAGHGLEVAPFDTPAEYYRKLRDGSMNFLFVQFGLCSFKYSTTEKKWLHRAYNFYIFPKPYNRNHSDVRFQCQSSCMDFLSANGFDFNKLFRDGIPYLTMTDEIKQRDYLMGKHSKEKQTKTPSKDIIPIPEDLVEFVSNFCLQVEDFIKSDETELEFKASNAFMRKLLYQTVDTQYSEDVCLETRSNLDGNRILFIMKVASEEEREKHEEERRESEIQELEDAVGFSKVVRLLTASGKMVAGHNMMLDMCHLLHQFCERLPPDYLDFKEMLHGLFPRLIDTKYLASSQEFRDHIKSTVLNHLIETLSEEPFAMPDVDVDPEGEGYSVESEKYHEAGYDAYITGLCLIAMANHLDAKSMHPNVESLPLLKPFMNKILLMRSQDNGFINLSGNDPVLPRDHVFHLTFPKEWKNPDIINLFKPIGTVFISWLNDTSAYVALHEREKAASVLKTLAKSGDCKILPYHRYRHLMETSGTWTPQSPSTKRPEQDKNGSMKRKRQGLPTRESKLTRRSIDTILEEDISTSPGITITFYSLLVILTAVFLYHAFVPGNQANLLVILTSLLSSPLVLYSLPPRFCVYSCFSFTMSLHSIMVVTAVIHVTMFPHMLGGSQDVQMVYWLLAALMPVSFGLIVSDIVDV